MEYSINLHPILYLTLLISKFTKNEKYYHTNVLIKIDNELQPELVRLRKDKNDYIFLNDTNFHIIPLLNSPLFIQIFFNIFFNKFFRRSIQFFWQII